MSKLGHLDKCPGYKTSDETSAASEEGTDLHEIMDVVAQRVASEVNNRRPNPGWVATLNALMSSPDWETLTSGMDFDEAHQYYLSYCCRQADSLMTPATTLIRRECRVTLKNDAREVITAGHYDLLVEYSGGFAVLVDWKFGWIPVTSAQDNLQGLGYALGILATHPRIMNIGVMFVQPKLGTTTTGIFYRRDYARHRTTLSAVVARAVLMDDLFDQGKPDANRLCDGDHCKYCVRKSICPRTSKAVVAVATRMSPVTLPASFDPERIKTPEDAALLKTALDIVEDAIGPLKERIREICVANGGSIEAQVGDDTVAYKVQRRNLPRTLGDSALVADAVQDVLGLTEVLACAKLSVGGLEEAYANAAVQNASASGLKLTKKAAVEELHARLESDGLISRPDGYTENLVRVRAKKQLTN